MAEKRKSNARTDPLSTVTLSESDIAMIDALGILFHIAIGGREAAGRQVAGAFDSRIEHWTKNGAQLSDTVRRLVEKNPASQTVA